MTFPTDAGETVHINPDDTKDSFPGKKVLLWWYRGSEGKRCKQQAETFTQMHFAYTRQNTQVLGVSNKSADDHKPMRDHINTTFPLLCDPEKKLLAALQTKSPRW